MKSRFLEWDIYLYTQLACCIVALIIGLIAYLCE